VFTARYELSPYIKQIRFVFKGLNHCGDTSCPSSTTVHILYRMTNWKPNPHRQQFNGNCMTHNARSIAARTVRCLIWRLRHAVQYVHNTRVKHNVTSVFCSWMCGTVKYRIFTVETNIRKKSVGRNFFETLFNNLFTRCHACLDTERTHFKHTFWHAASYSMHTHTRIHTPPPYISYEEM
jgi:hypothetical protein